jgi:hypothetical protein
MVKGKENRLHSNSILINLVTVIIGLRKMNAVSLSEIFSASGTLTTREYMTPGS